MPTATPTRDIVTRSLRTFLARLTACGWEIEAPGVTAPGSVSYCLIARAPESAGELAGRTHLLYVYSGAQVLEVDDLWRLVSDTRLTGADDAVMCLDGEAMLSPAARNTAALLHVRVLRLG